MNTDKRIGDRRQGPTVCGTGSNVWQSNAPGADETAGWYPCRRLVKDRRKENPDPADAKLRRIRAEFIALSRPLIRFLCDNYHPHVAVIVTSTNAQIMEGLVSTGEIMDYVHD